MGWTKLRHGRDLALGELDKYYEGPIRGLQLAPEFYKLLGSSDLQNTPLGRSLGIQNQILGEISASLGGQAFGRTGKNKGAGALPPDMLSAIGENLTSNLAQAGIEGSPAGAIQAAMRFSGASEQIRSQRINQALNAVGALGGASIYPSASQWANLGAQKAETAARLQYNFGEQQQQAVDQRGQYWGNLAGQLGGMALSGALGGLAAPSGFGLAGIAGGLTGRPITSFNPNASRQSQPSWMSYYYGT